jgi:hypothetical protein
MGADSSLRADEVELLEKLEAKHRRPAEQSPYKRRMTFKLAHRSRRFDALGLSNEFRIFIWTH